ncbi:unnamed protein product, partial [Ectocarpus sp. 12 AP-2014]
RGGAGFGGPDGEAGVASPAVRDFARELPAVLPQLGTGPAVRDSGLLRSPGNGSRGLAHRRVQAGSRGQRRLHAGGHGETLRQDPWPHARGRDGSRQRW